MSLVSLVVLSGNQLFSYQSNRTILLSVLCNFGPTAVVLTPLAVFCNMSDEICLSADVLDQRDSVCLCFVGTTFSEEVPTKVGPYALAVSDGIVDGIAQ